MSIRTSLLAAGLALAATAAAAQQPIPLPDAIRSAGVVRIGIEATYPPMAYKDPATNERRGFNVDLVTEIARVLGLRIQWEEMAFAQLIPALTTNRIDFSGSSMTDLPSRRDRLSFVDYVSTGPQIFAMTAQSGDINQPTDLCGKAIATPRTTAYFPTLQAWSQANCVAQGRPAITVVGTEGATATRTDLRQNRVQAAVLGAEYVVYLGQQEPGAIKAIGTPIGRNLSGLAFPKESTVLRDAVAAALDRLIADGTYMALLKKHGLEAQALARAEIDAGQP
ncbi:ABC transporter substrate-binding protein [Phreatobacter oligotrophus]|jgi:polar amino acid transport system substrate-binding protein|uniref:Amino acid ABC transporter substrate-binding protein (PAAT family) n=1 Tax=Phreatobacter oligotrophus TaxID=1122261 RepID=A0A2T4Z6C9_9HYPH|nr:ABC transporter substrate-binding protein [Phreatobacter oligotrophus]PTM57442.1 amino acid ABC transporter substrate-binding protein (PAAT family) [Phreatobacter oligotrophus]